MEHKKTSAGKSYRPALRGLSVAMGVLLASSAFGAALNSSEVTFNITGSGGSNGAVLNAFTVTGQPNPFDTIIVPDSVRYQFATPAATSEFLMNRDVIGNNITDGPAVFDPALLDANKDRDLTHYLSLDQTINGTDYLEFAYTHPTRAAANRYVLVTERNGNNAMEVQALDSGGALTGNALPTTPGSTYIDSGVDAGVPNSNATQNVFVTIYPLTDLVPANTPISGIRLTQSGATGSDGGDGKVFLMLDSGELPQVTNDTPTTQTDTPKNLDVLANDTDDGGNAALTVVQVSTPDQGGSATINADNRTIDYVPAAGFTGTETFTYTVYDNDAGTATGTVTVTVAANQPPVASDDTATVQAGASQTIGVLANDSDPDGDTLTITAVGAPDNGGSAVINGNAIDYTPAAGFTGTETFTYTISDGKGGNDTANVTVTVTTAPNQPPVASDDTATVQAGATQTLNVLANDSDPDGDTLTITAVGAPDNGGSAVINGNAIDYTPAAGFAGTETFSYTVSDGKGGNDTANVTVTVTTTPNQPPVAGDDTATVQAGATQTLNVLANDSDPDGDTLTITAVGAPDNGGNAVINGNAIDYTPAAGFTGAETFSYTVSDGKGGSDTASVTANVTQNAPDFDGDGIADDTDIDDDNDGIPDTVEGTADFDGDGLPNYQDPDADGDGILDLAESGLNASERGALDADGDGRIDSHNSFGANGLADDVETMADSGQTDYDNDQIGDAPVDTDGDGQPDFLDLDSDNDGIPDVIEAGLPDGDGDRRADNGQHTLTPPDTDRDGIPDVHDLDSDGDGKQDISEAGFADTDDDGRIDGFTDADHDGYDDTLAARPLALPDGDGNGVPDFLEPDCSGCQLTTGIEGHGGGGMDWFLLAALLLIGFQRKGVLN